MLLVPSTTMTTCSRAQAWELRHKTLLNPFKHEVDATAALQSNDSCCMHETQQHGVESFRGDLIVLMIRKLEIPYDAVPIRGTHGNHRNTNPTFEFENQVKEVLQKCLRSGAIHSCLFACF